MRTVEEARARFDAVWEQIGALCHEHGSRNLLLGVLSKDQQSGLGIMNKAEFEEGIEHVRRVAPQCMVPNDQLDPLLDELKAIRSRFFSLKVIESRARHAQAGKE